MKDKTYPRYFTHEQGFSDDTKYLRIDKPGGYATLIFGKDNKESNQFNPDGSIFKNWWDEEQCEENCSDRWKEITREEAEKL